MSIEQRGGVTEIATDKYSIGFGAASAGGYLYATTSSLCASPEPERDDVEWQLYGRKRTAAEREQDDVQNSGHHPGEYCSFCRRRIPVKGETK